MFTTRLQKNFTVFLLLFSTLLIGSCGNAPSYVAEPDSPVPVTGDISLSPTVEFTLVTGLVEGKLSYVGQGGGIEGKINPSLNVQVDDVVRITVINGDAMEHDLSIMDFGLSSESVIGKGARAVVVFRVSQPGDFVYFCSVPGHRKAGMEGRLIVIAENAEDQNSDQAH